MKRVLLAALFLAGCAAPLRQSPPAGLPASVAAPKIAPGASWTYSVRDGFTGLMRPAEHYRVTEAGAGRVVVTVSREGQPDETRVFDSEWNGLKHPATNMQAFEYRPAYPAFAFPLAAGKTWKTRLIATDPADGRRFPMTVYGEVLGWERVRVPAGEFDTLKVRRLVYFDYWEHVVRGRSEIIETDWYAPAAGLAVRREATSRYLSYLYGGIGFPFFFTIRVGGRDDDGGGPRMIQDDWLIYELTAYSPR